MLEIIVCTVYNKIIMAQNTPSRQTTPQKKSSMSIKDYSMEMDSIILQMLHVLIRAQRKIDDIAYRKILKKIDEQP
jgi:hypothetical protein